MRGRSPNFYNAGAPTQLSLGISSQKRNSNQHGRGVCLVWAQRLFLGTHTQNSGMKVPVTKTGPNTSTNTKNFCLFLASKPKTCRPKQRRLHVHVHVHCMCKGTTGYQIWIAAGSPMFFFVLCSSGRRMQQPPRGAEVRSTHGQWVSIFFSIV